jgi:hypothetical protein
VLAFAVKVRNPGIKTKSSALQRGLLDARSTLSPMENLEAANRARVITVKNGFRFARSKSFKEGKLTYFRCTLLARQLPSPMRPLINILIPS